MTDTTDHRQTPARHEVALTSDTTVVPGRSRRRATGRDRRHLTPGRPRQVKIRYTDDEYAALADAARLAGLTPTGYAGEAALAAARQTTPPSTAPWRQALVELMAARGQVRRFGNNVNQAARMLNALGDSPEWLARAVAVTERAVTRLDEAAATVTIVARADRTTGSRPRAAVAGAHDSQASANGHSACTVAGQRTDTVGRPMADNHYSGLADSHGGQQVSRTAAEGAL